MKREKVTICSGENYTPLCIELLISRLQSSIGVERMKARTALVRIGKPAVPYITTLLSHKNDLVRWEACKSLEQIRDPETARALAPMMLDEDMDVRWVAADALIELEQHAIIPVLEIIEEHFDSVILREAAHHVLHTLKEGNLLDNKTEEVLQALTINGLSSNAAFMANNVLDHLRAQKLAKHHRWAVL
ncbi:MAG: HEAT repeat domain-containing protein [Bacteroidota bacterium]